MALRHLLCCYTKRIDLCTDSNKELRRVELETEIILLKRKIILEKSNAHILKTENIMLKIENDKLKIENDDLKQKVKLNNLNTVYANELEKIQKNIRINNFFDIFFDI